MSLTGILNLMFDKHLSLFCWILCSTGMLGEAFDRDDSSTVRLGGWIEHLKGELNWMFHMNIEVIF